MHYALSSSLGSMSGLNTDKLALDLQFATDKSLTARRGPTPTFSRASGATQVGSTGLIEYAPENLVLRSQEFNTTWAVNNAMTVTPDAVTAPDGTLTADAINFDTNTSSRIIQFTGSAVVHTFSVWLRADTDRTCVIETQAASAVPISLIANVTTEWQRFSIVATNWTSGTGSFNVRIANNAAGTSGTIFAWGAQLERYDSARTYIPTTTAAVYGARFDHDPITLACKGLLIEEQRTNLMVQSENFGTTWPTVGITVDLNQTASPSGSVTADQITSTTSNGAIYQTFSATAGVTYTFSVWVKTVSSNVSTVLRINNNTGGNLASVNITTSSSWKRVTITHTSANTETLRATIGGGSTLGVNATLYVWGAQLEAGSFPTSYIPTVASTVVRSADVCSITGSAFTGFYNQSEGAILVNAFTPASGDRTIVATDDNTANEMIRLRTEGTNPLFKVTDGGSEVVAIDSGTVSANTSFKLIGAYKVNNFASSINGGSPVTDTAGTIPTVDRMRIGAGQGGNTMCGCISSLRYFKKRVSDSKLQTLTT